MKNLVLKRLLRIFRTYSKRINTGEKSSELQVIKNIDRHGRGFKSESFEIPRESETGYPE